MPRIIVSSLIGLDTAAQAPSACDEVTPAGSSPDDVRGDTHDGPPPAAGPMGARGFWAYI